MNATRANDGTWGGNGLVAIPVDSDGEDLERRAINDHGQDAESMRKDGGI